MPSTTDKPRRIRAGLYEYRDHCIIRADWGGEGPRGGVRYVWEVGYFDDQGVPTIDGAQFRTLAEAVGSIRDQRQAAT